MKPVSEFVCVSSLSVFLMTQGREIGEKIGCVALSITIFI